MRFCSELIPATLIRRYKRFLADVMLDDRSVATVHVANPGSMMGLQAPGSRVWLSRSPNLQRKLPLSLELIEVDFGGGNELVGINTGNPNAIVAEALKAEAIAELRGYEIIRREVRYGRASRVDVLLQDPSRPDCYVEVKNVHLMRRQNLAEFPDSVTDRGARHLDELATVAQAGSRAVMLFVIQIASATAFDLAADLDPAYASAFDRAGAAGVEMIAYTCRVGHDGVTLSAAVPIVRQQPS